MLQTIIDALGGWSWWILGLILLAVEVFAPGLFFLWFGIAAILIGIGALVFDWPWQFQVLGFLALSVVAVLIGRRFAVEPHGESEDPLLNVPAGRLRGRTFVLAEPIVEGRGRMRVDDTIWQVRGPDTPAGTRVVVTGADGPVLNVQPAG